MSTLREQGWEVLPGLVAEQVASWRSTFATLGERRTPQLRQLTSRLEPHDRDRWGRILNPVVVTRDPALAPTLQGVLHHVLPSVVARFGPPALTQAVWVHSTRGTALHQDLHPIEADAPMLGVWIALEDIHADAGPFVVVPGSLSLNAEDSDVSEWRRAADEAARLQFQTLEDRAGRSGRQASELLTDVLGARGLRPEPVPLRAGDVLLWSGALIHGSETPKPGPRTRQSLLLHLVERRFAT